jgi:sialate O-acetylesterase
MPAAGRPFAANVAAVAGSIAVMIARVIAIFAIGLGATARPARADVSLPAVFGDHMVLQEGRKIPFWGTADPGEEVTIAIGSAAVTITAGPDGRWRAALGPLTAREPFTITVRGRNTITLSDVVTGEVWLASGQSNMEWPLLGARDAEAELLAARHPNLRLFQVEKPNPNRLSDRAVPVVGRWTRATPDDAALFSAVGYFFGRELLRKLDRPIGILHASWGGTPAEAWTSRQALAKQPALRHLVARLPTRPTPEAARAYDEALARWQEAGQPPLPDNRGFAAGFARVADPPPGWQPIELPGAWEKEPALAGFDGVVWLRREVRLPPTFVGKALTLRLGAIDQCDTTYVNGTEVGATCKERRPEQWPRIYDVPAALTKTGRVVIAVRVVDTRGPGGLVSPRERLRLHLADVAEGPALALGGEWQYKVEAPIGRPAPRGPRPTPPPGLPDQNSPGYLYDNMLAGLIPYGIRGAIWYQGEANTFRAHQYRTLLPTLIEDWRRAFGQGPFPFLVVQLANFHPRWPGPGSKSEEEWPELREAQLLTAQRHPAAGLAVTVDVGDRNDIHPTNKQEVGRRLALVALAKTYGQALDHSGPLYAGVRTEKGGRLRLRFQHADGLQVAGPPGERLIGFEVAGADRRFVAAEATIDRDTVVLSAPTVPRPVAARYGWTDDPACNLTNRSGLPASPFRTDGWPGLTVGRK